MEQEKCPCCPNHCEKENLSCGRGREYFSDANHDSLPETREQEVIMDLRKCGHMLHHNRDLDTNSLLSDFSEEELEQLHRLLEKIYNKAE